MNMIVCCCSLRKSIVTGVVTLFSLFIFQAVFAADPQEGESAAPETTTPIEIEKSESDYEYQVENRPDPFAPFVTGTSQNNQVRPDEIVDNNEVLTGMQLFEPGQLTLVALMLTGGDKLAMVQDFTGRGYVIEEGMKVGRRGVITNITEDRVIIEETARTRSGKVLKNEIAMVLKREGEE
jgi:Tfp pilus assembly protein PilP